MILLLYPFWLLLFPDWRKWRGCLTGGMEQILKNFVWDTAKAVLILGGLLLPMIVLVWWIAMRQKRYKAESEEPFTDLPIRPPGESLRLKIQRLDDKLSERLLLLIFLPCFLAAMVSANPHLQTKLSLTLFFVVCVGLSLWLGPRVAKTLRELWNYRLGFDGERVVGEELNQLMLGGYRVFHDVPFEGFNIDHIVVGPPGVYAIETKARRKPKDKRGKKEYHVGFDGTALHWPKKQETEEIEQAALNARTLGQWLTGATGEKVTANPVLVIPGWYVDRTGKGSVNVLNEKEVRYSFPARPSNPLSPEQIRRIAHQLSEKCRLPKE
jgi:hypothetical protein